MDPKGRDIVVRIRRFDPLNDLRPHWQDYRLRVEPGMTVLEGIHRIREGQDPSLAWRYSCRMGVCGSCGMLINGRPGLACNTQILDVTEAQLVLAPLPNYEIVKDLVPELAPLFEKHTSVKPFIVRADEPPPEAELLQSPEELERYLQFTYCIRCGCCLAACPTVATDPSYLGPMPLAQGHRYNTDTRDGGFAERRAILGSRHGAFRCHYAGECSNVCPKGVDPARAVQLLKRDLVLSYLRLWKHQLARPCQGPRPGAKRREGIPDAPAHTIKSEPAASPEPSRGAPLQERRLS